MSAAIQLTDRRQSRTASPDGEQFRPGSAPEQLSELETLRRQLCASEAEVRALREELARTLHSLNISQALLRNAALRERELRTELVKGIF
ncbi:MAG TPA: hypothetical protein VFD58_16740 [Blastocatellia bacterium]|nr:hypothetical protein [Blastocatellia bacterium]